MTKMNRRGVVAALVTLPFAPAAFAQAPSAAPRRVLGQDKQRLSIVNDKGEVVWGVACSGVAHDVSYLPTGNVLVQTRAENVVEMDKDGKTVWQWDAKPKAGYDGRVEIHAFQRLPNGLTMIAETGNKRIIEVDASGKIVREVALTVENPHPHRDTRMVRKLKSGNYLACHEADGVVREYDPMGKVVWAYKLDLAGRPRTPHHDGHGTEVFGAVRLNNGNTLIAGGNNNRVLEVNPQGNTVWSVNHDELPGVRLFWVTTLHALPNGNVIIGNTHAGPDNPQLIEVRAVGVGNHGRETQISCSRAKSRSRT